MGKKYITGYRAQTRTMALRYTVSVSILLLVIAVLQSSVFGKLRIFGAVPDLMICTVLIIAFFFGQYAGAITGIGAGWLIEAIGGGTGILILPVIYLLCGYLTGYLAKSASARRYPVYLIYLGIVLLLRAGTTVTYACLSYQYIDLPKILLQTVLPELIATAICGSLLYAPLKVFCAALEKK